jgi:putative ABC transport system permease protein
MILALAIKSLRNRRLTAALTVLAIAVSVALLLGVEHIRQASRESFASSVSGTDLIVGARTSPVNLLLSSVFRIGNATNNISWEAYRRIAESSPIAWTIPLSLGDSHRGFRVLGTSGEYFDHYRFAQNRQLELAQGKRFMDADEAVLGADVAEALGYRLGQEIVIAHGAGDVAFTVHSDHPFHVVGILARTGTPVDRTIHVSLEGMDAVHADHSAGGDPLAAAMRAAGARDTQRAHDADSDRAERAGHASDSPKRAITAVLVGLKSRNAALSVQRQLNESSDEPLTAILPGATLLEVWEILAAGERTLFAVSLLVVVMGLAGMLIALLTSLGERRREMAVLRAIGARPWHVFALILGEAAFLTALGIALGIAVLYVGLGIGRSWLEQRFGLFITPAWPSLTELGFMMMVAASGVLIGLIPAYRIYRLSLADGMTIRI